MTDIIGQGGDEDGSGGPWRGFAAFSPDARRLAVAVTQYSSTDTAAQALSNTIIVADAVSRHLAEVPAGAGFVSANLSNIGWTPDGQWLLLPTYDVNGHTQLHAWRLGAPDLRTALDSEPWLSLAIGPPPA